MFHHFVIFLQFDVLQVEKKRTQLCSVDFNLIVYVLVIIFGMGSWIAVNGLWVELPILVNEAPEGWSLPSYIVILVQIANIGPLVYTLVNRLVPKHFNEKHGVYFIVIIGAAACLMLVFLWKKTAYVAGAERSIGLFVCVFLLALVDCTSSVVFLAYMSILKPLYIPALFIGNGMSGFVPGVVALGQNVGETLCLNKPINSSTNQTKVVAEYVQPNFPIEDFFYVLFGLMLLCGVAFTFLHYLPYCKKHHVSIATEFDGKSGNMEAMNKVVTLSYTKTDSEGVKRKPKLKESGFVVIDKSEKEDNEKVDATISVTQGDFIVLMILTTALNGVKNGVITSISSYATLPYGDTAFLLAATLMSIIDPIACGVAFFLTVKSVWAISLVVLVAFGLTAYVVAIASYSPDPPMADETIGIVLIVCI